MSQLGFLHAESLAHCERRFHISGVLGLGAASYTTFAPLDNDWDPVAGTAILVVGIVGVIAFNMPRGIHLLGSR